MTKGIWMTVSVLALSYACTGKPFAHVGQVSSNSTSKARATPWHGPHTSSAVTNDLFPVSITISAASISAAQTVGRASAYSVAHPSSVASAVTSHLPVPLANSFSKTSSSGISIGTAASKPTGFATVLGPDGSPPPTTLAPRPTPTPDYNCKAPYDLGWPTFRAGGTCVNYASVATTTSIVNCLACPSYETKTTSKPANTGFPSGIGDSGIPFVFPSGCANVQIQPVITITAVRCAPTITAGASLSREGKFVPL